MRIASYNLYEGAQDTYAQLQDFVAEQKPDVLCLQEANGWNDGAFKRLDDFAAHTGLSHYVYGDSNTRFKLASFSRLPILASEVLTDGFWHSAVGITVNYKEENLDVWNVHLNPKSEDARVREVERLLNHISGIATGDFNSLSVTDQYPDDMVDMLAAQGITKFGIKELRYDVTRLLTDAGLVDAAVELGVADTTVPTPANKDKHHATEMRLDYMFVSPGFVKALKRFEVPKNSLTDEISDHYPVVLDLE